MSTPKKPQEEDAKARVVDLWLPGQKTGDSGTCHCLICQHFRSQGKRKYEGFMYPENKGETDER